MRRVLALLLALPAAAVSSSPGRAAAEDHDVELGWSQTFGVVAGSLTTGGGARIGPSLGLGIRARWDGDAVWEEHIGLEALLGDRVGLDVRAHHLASTRGQDPSWILAVGAAIVSENRIDDTPLQLPSVFGLFLPEIGAVLRPDRDAQLYICVTAPVKLALSEHFGAELRLSAFLVDGWKVDDEPESLLVVELNGWHF